MVLLTNIYSYSYQNFLSFLLPRQKVLSLGNLPDNLFKELGVPKNGANIIIIGLLFSDMLFFILQPIINVISRHNEFAADKMGSELAGVGGEIELANALKKLVTENKSFPLSHPIYIFFHYTHPPVLERLRELGVDIEDTAKNALEGVCQADI